LADYSAIPEYLRSLKQFCVRVSKQPYIRGKKGFISRSWPKNKENWLTFEEAIRAVDRKEIVIFQDKPCPVEAIGFLMARVDQQPPFLIGGDIDCCVDPETLEVSNWASNFLLKILPFYTEISPSKCGIRFFILGNLGRDKLTGDGDQNDMSNETRERIFKAKPMAFAKFQKGEPVFNTLELYEAGRHLSLTGSIVDDFCFPKEDRTMPVLKAIEPFLIKELPTDVAKSNPNSVSSLPKLNILDVINTTGFTQSGDQLLGPHPTLGSTTGHNLVVNPGKDIYCYMHDGLNAGGDAWIWLACESGALPWDKAKSGALRDRSLLEKTLQYAVSKGLISEKEAQIDLSSAVRKVDANSPFWSIGMSETNGTVVRVEPGKSNKEKKILTWVSDCVTWIESETICADDTEFVFRGKGARDQREVTFTLPASAMSEPRRLMGAMFNAFGASNRIGELKFEDIQNMTNHTKVLTKVETPRWDGSDPLIPGYDVGKNIKFELAPQIPVGVYDGDIETAKKALRLLFKIHKYSCILVTTILGAPAVVRWHPSYRFGIGLWGTSGNFKTRTATYAMGIWGLGFLEAPQLMAGSGASTVNGAMDVFKAAGFMPCIYDDVKIVDKKRDILSYVSLIHKVMEGYEKIRSRKEGGLRETIKFESTPIITGEVKPQEASTSARIMGLNWSLSSEEKITASKYASELQKIQLALPTIGYHWIKFLHETDEVLGPEFLRYRDAIAVKFSDAGYVNSGRLSGIYAMLKSEWALLEVSPLGEVFVEFRDQFIKTLDEAILDQGEQVCRETEVSKFLRTLSYMITVEPSLIQARSVKGPITPVQKPPIGKWTSEGLFLLPELALNLVAKQGVFEQIPDVNSMSRSLNERKALIIDTDGKHIMKKMRINGSNLRGWLIIPEALNGLKEPGNNLPVVESLSVTPGK